jgi:hypothetical protein
MRSIWHTFVAVALSAAAHGADLTAIGGWNENAHGNVTAGVGLQSTVESTPGATALTISNTTGGWTLRIRRGVGAWNDDLKLFVRRSSAGIGSGTISGGEAYVEVTAGDVAIFSGSDDRSSIALQYKLTGLSHNVSPNVYTASLLFTVQ